MAGATDSWRSHVYIELSGNIPDSLGDGGQQVANAFDDARTGAAIWVSYGNFVRQAREDVREPVPVQARQSRIVSDSSAQLQYQELICSYDWNCDDALRIVRCESGFDALNESPDGQNIGLFQINLIHGFSLQELGDPVFNVRVAYAIWLDQGWGPWTCKPS